MIFGSFIFLYKGKSLPYYQLSYLYVLLCMTELGMLIITMIDQLA